MKCRERVGRGKSSEKEGEIKVLERGPERDRKETKREKKKVRYRGRGRKAEGREETIEKRKKE